MKEFPVGSVCIIVESYPEYKGKECTIVEGMHKCLVHNREGKVFESKGYSVKVQGHEDQLFHALHTELKLKRFPGQLQSWLNKKMNDLYEPKPWLVMEAL
jgi:hypothetical protein